MTRKARAFRLAHGLVNRLAWRFACPPGPQWGRALRIDRAHPLWRLNDWLAAGWTGEYVCVAIERGRRERIGK
jgi:hypothetical protein